MRRSRPHGRPHEDHLACPHASRVPWGRRLAVGRTKNVTTSPYARTVQHVTFLVTVLVRRGGSARRVVVRLSTDSRAPRGAPRAAHHDEVRREERGAVDDERQYPWL